MTGRPGGDGKARGREKLCGRHAACDACNEGRYLCAGSDEIQGWKNLYYRQQLLLFALVFPRTIVTNLNVHSNGIHSQWWKKEDIQFLYRIGSQLLNAHITLKHVEIILSVNLVSALNKSNGDLTLAVQFLRQYSTKSCCSTGKHKEGISCSKHGNIGKYRLSDFWRQGVNIRYIFAQNDDWFDPRHWKYIKNIWWPHHHLASPFEMPMRLTKRLTISMTHFMSLRTLRSKLSLN